MSDMEEQTIVSLVREEIDKIESLVDFDSSNDEINSALAKANELNTLLTDLATDVEEMACRIDGMHHEEDEDEEE